MRSPSLLVVLLFLLLLRTLVIHRRPHETVMDEERESLDATSLFNAQLHAFLSGLRPRRTSSWEDPLTPGSVRYLYRAVLEAASRRGLPRRSSETPDEYLARFPAVPAPAGDRALHGQAARGGAPRVAPLAAAFLRHA